MRRNYPQKKWQKPSRASLTVTVTTVLAVTPFTLSGLDPFKAGVPVLIGFGSFGIIFLQAFAAIAIVVFLRRHGGAPGWVMVASWLGAVGLIAATLFVAAYFRLLATSDIGWVGWLPLVFPTIVAPFLGLAAWARTIRPKQIISEAELDTRASPARTFSTSGTAPQDFAIRGDTSSPNGAWTIRYVDSVGRERASEAKPSLDAAMVEARRLRDARGATILEVVAHLDRGSPA